MYKYVYINIYIIIYIIYIHLFIFNDVSNILYSNHFNLITNVHRMSVSNNVFVPQTLYL